ncbi:MAG: hypothetical protein K5769_06090 [Pseudobutyrivibrio sp.]|nr:hypothetical protein [Pseudobutyrivibrio sp.]
MEISIGVAKEVLKVLKKYAREQLNIIINIHGDNITGAVSERFRNLQSFLDAASRHITSLDYAMRNDIPNTTRDSILAVVNNDINLFMNNENLTLPYVLSQLTEDQRLYNLASHGETEFIRRNLRPYMENRNHAALQAVRRENTSSISKTQNI